MICWIGSVDRVDDLCLTNQIYSALLNVFEFKEITVTEVHNAHFQMLLEDDETRHHLARLLKYYPRRSCAPSLIRSRFFSHTTNLLTVLTFLHFEISYMYTRGRPKPCEGNKQPCKMGLTDQRDSRCVLIVLIKAFIVLL